MSSASSGASSVRIVLFMLTTLPLLSFAKRKSHLSSRLPPFTFVGPRPTSCSSQSTCHMFSGGKSGGNDENTPTPVSFNGNGNNITKNDSSATNAASSKISGTSNPIRLAVLKLGATEPRFTSPLNYEKRRGTYLCAGCGISLFSSDGKYDSGSGWPSFWRTSEGNVRNQMEWDGRMECVCKSCGGHLGHAFNDGPARNMIDLEKGVPESDYVVTGGRRMPRFCINGLALQFVAEVE